MADLEAVNEDFGDKFLSIKGGHRGVKGHDGCKVEPEFTEQLQLCLEGGQAK